MNKLRILKAHQSNYPNPIQFEPGACLTVGEQDDQYHGWVKVTTEDGNLGWAPMAYIQLQQLDNTGIALSAYDATELNVSVGQVLTRVAELNGWYWCVDENGSYGWVPGENCAPMD